MTTGHKAQKPSRVVPVIAALVGAVGVIVAALITTGALGDGDDTSGTDPVVTTTEPDTAPEIAGRYHLDEGNPRIILVRHGDGDSYLISEELPADWPFEGVVEHVEQELFEGDATFASGQTMNMAMRLLANGHLAADFEFTDSDGVPTGRVDHHVLVPAV